MKIILIFSILTTQGFFTGAIVQPESNTLAKCSLKAMTMRDNWVRYGLTEGDVYVACKYK